MKEYSYRKIMTGEKTVKVRRNFAMGSNIEKNLSANFIYLFIAI